MQIEKGKFYLTRAGDKVGPMERYQDGWHVSVVDGRLWHSNGKRFFRDAEEHDSDLVSEWRERTSPIQRVLVESIKAGQYGFLNVQPDQTSEERVIVSISHHQAYTTSASFGAKELREAISTLSEIADFLEEK